MQEGRVFEDGEQMKVWITDDFNHLLMKVETKIWAGTIKAILTDYKLLKTIFEKLYSTNHIFTMEDAIKLLEDNSSIFQINSEIEPYQGMLKSFVEDEAKGFTKSENFFKK